jgi:hypothetical protein
MRYEPKEKGNKVHNVDKETHVKLCFHVIYADDSSHFTFTGHHV